MRKVILLILSLAAILLAKPNNIYLEAMGNAGFYSFNYERELFKIGISRSNIRIGIEYLNTKLIHNDLKSVYGVVAPLMITELIGNEKHNAEIGFGIVPIYRAIEGKKEFKNIAAFALGYRYLFINDMFIKACLTPLVDYQASFSIVPSAGIGIGYSF